MDVDPTAGSERNAQTMTAQDELVAVLDSILGPDGYWQVPAVSKPLTITHSWDDGSVDVLVITNARNAYGYREDPTGREVTTLNGSLVEADRAMRALPAPGVPDAPNASDHTPGLNGVWT